jgi:hypothetical protein
MLLLYFSSVTNSLDSTFQDTLIKDLCPELASPALNEVMAGLGESDSLLPYSNPTITEEETKCLTLQASFYDWNTIKLISEISHILNL